MVKLGAFSRASHPAGANAEAASGQYFADTPFQRRSRGETTLDEHHHMPQVAAEHALAGDATFATAIRDGDVAAAAHAAWGFFLTHQVVVASCSVVELISRRAWGYSLAGPGTGHPVLPVGLAAPNLACCCCILGHPVAPWAGSSLDGSWAHAVTCPPAAAPAAHPSRGLVGGHE
jgi:hypothetical protein